MVINLNYLGVFLKLLAYSFLFMFVYLLSICDDRVLYRSRWICKWTYRGCYTSATL